VLRGFDVSHYQGAVDWADLKRRYGIAFGACKATEGVSLTDNQFKANWSKLAAIDVVRMAYHYGHPARDPERSADVFLDHITRIEPTDLLVLDLETSDGLSQTTVNAWAKAWAAHVRKLAAGHSPVLYAGAAYMENDTGKGLNGPYGSWWYPRYPNAFVDTTSWPAKFNPRLPSPNAWGGPPKFWQFTASFLTPDHVLDANVFNGTLAQLHSLNGDDDMPLTSDEIDKIAERVWKKDGLIRNLSVADPTDPAAHGPANWFLSNLEDTQDKDHEALAQLTREVAAIKAKVDSLSVGGVDYDLLAAKVVDLFASRLQS
jgi:GH25 family lysozyme M1 (1,4-beta-N-acetylmuramidase)